MEDDHDYVHETCYCVFCTARKTKKAVRLNGSTGMYCSSGCVAYLGGYDRIICDDGMVCLQVYEDEKRRSRSRHLEWWSVTDNKTVG